MDNCNDETLEDPFDTPIMLCKLKVKNINRLVIGHLNINSLPGKFDQLRTLCGKNIDILVLTETKLDSSFPNSQFAIDGFSVSFRCDRNRFGGGVLIHIRDDIPSKQVTKHKLPGDIEEVFVEINLRKTKWLIFGTYCPPNQSAEYFFKQTGYALDTYNQIYEKFLFAGDFNLEESEPCLSEFLSNHYFKNFVKEKNMLQKPYKS